MIRLTRPSLGEEESAAVARVLASGMLVQGPEVARFEELLAERCERAHAVAVSSGTSALELALAALGVGPGDEVLVPALTWPSPAHAVSLRGATPVPVDVHPREWNATGEALAAARTERTTAAIVIDQLGNPCRRAAIEAALGDLPILEDAACALGSHFPDAPCGSMGRVSCLSFHPRKVLTTGEGGMCLTDDDALADALRVLRNHGQRSAGQFVRPAGNQRLTDIAGAIGVVQVGRLDGILEARRARAARYREALPGLAVQQAPPGSRPNHQTFGALWPTAAAPVREALRARGIEAGALSYSLSQVPTVPSAPCPVAEDIVARGLSLPLYPEMSDEEQDRVVEAVRELLEEAGADG